MKKILTMLSLTLLIGFSAQAQTSQEDVQIEMEKMMDQMQQLMKGFGGWINEAPMFKDSTLVREFHFPTEEFDGMIEQFPMEGLTDMMFKFSPDSLMQSDMFKGMEDMMHMWSNQDFTEMEEFFKDMEKMMPELQTPQTPSDPRAPKEKKTKKKKRKTSTL